ncbi:flavin monoamine oxidase family protein [Bradyrhizobium sp. CCGB01]|uniref:flavin monoamine oxidase family protein n=1 Tax=Bradyrhizobium sp. CCGB01 TaxID=2949634 RepID=UPI0020B30762|nr:FAD-dependent oxidoreductase [Bradyrhizobium sp. CCGB01]MCP3411776.1 FAD-dependent oxidoreductase [Bradyrhizobium sp. CCGB01]
MRSLFARLHRRYGPKISGAERQRRVRDKVALQPTPPSIRSPTALRALAVRRPKVAIIGGGFAGLMAASELVAHCEVTLFEARNRFGGRVFSKTKPSGIVEAGGELIGYNHPLWLQYAKRFELGLSVITSDTNFDALELDMPLFLDGHKLSDGQMKLVYHEMDDAFGKLSRWAGRVNPRKPWLANGAKKLDARSIAKWIASLDCSKLTRYAMEEQFSNDAGQPTTEQSFLANLAVVAGGRMKNQIDAFFTQTETLRCSEGNQELAIRLAKDIGDKGASTHLSTPVRAIRIEDEGVILEFSPAENGTTRAAFTADYAVLAIPPSLWPDSPNAKITITPNLPHDYYVTMGTAVKYLSPLTKRFWIGEGLAPTAISNQFGVTWEGTDNQIAPPDRPVELSLFAGADVAAAALKHYQPGNQTQVDAFYAQQIGSVYTGYVKHLAAQPEFMAWPRDEWTAAGYSCPAPGEVCRAGPRLARGFEDRLFFAGEHTCFAYFGYMEGALQSGQTAAAAIIKAIDKQPEAHVSASNGDSVRGSGRLAASKP